jgi:glutamyl-tRNA reductase
MASNFLAAVGLSFREAPTAARAKVAEELDESTRAALSRQGMAGLVELHTCARSLWLISGDHPSWVAGLLQALIARKAGVMPVVLVGADAIRFALRVAVGLEAHVQGESDVGRQISHAFRVSQEQGQSDSILHTVEQAIHRLLAQGRSLGFIRANKGLGSLAVDRLHQEGILKTEKVGVVGAGAIGQRAVASLERAGHPVVLFNRSAREGALPLERLQEELEGGLKALIICTAAKESWLEKPSGVVVDLGLPCQCRGAIGLDSLLSGAGVRLSPERLAVAEALVEQEVELSLERLKAARWRRGLSSINELRDRFVAEELPEFFKEAAPELSEESRQRVVLAASRAIRQYNHTLLTCIKQDFFRGNDT